MQLESDVVDAAPHRLAEALFERMELGAREPERPREREVPVARQHLHEQPIVLRAQAAKPKRASSRKRVDLRQRRIRIPVFPHRSTLDPNPRRIKRGGSTPGGERAPVVGHAMGSKPPRKRKHRGGPSRSVLSLVGKRYPVHRLLWTGEYTERYEGAHPDTGEAVVLEVLRPAYREDPDVLARMRLLLALRAYLTHPNLMPLADVIVGGDLGTLGLLSASGPGVYLDPMERKLGTLEPHVKAWIGLSVGQAVLHLENKGAELGVPLVHGAFGTEHIFLRTDRGVLIDGIGSFVFQLWGPEGRDALIHLGERLGQVFPAPTLQ